MAQAITRIGGVIRPSQRSLFRPTLIIRDWWTILLWGPTLANLWWMLRMHAWTLTFAALAYPICQNAATRVTVASCVHRLSRAQGHRSNALTCPFQVTISPSHGSRRNIWSNLSSKPLKDSFWFQFEFILITFSPYSRVADRENGLKKSKTKYTIHQGSKWQGNMGKCAVTR